MIHFNGLIQDKLYYFVFIVLDHNKNVSKEDELFFTFKIKI